MTSRRLILGAAVAALLCLVALAIHSPPVRSAVGSWAVTKLYSTAGVRATIARLDYNLLTLTFSIGDVTLAAEGSTAPFLSARAVRVNLPWTILRGHISVESLEVDGPSVTIVRETDGTLNLPTGSGVNSQSTAPASIDVGRFVIHDLRVRYEDRRDGLLVDARSIDINLERPPGSPLRGRLSGRGATMRLSEQQTGLSKLGGMLTFDGTALALEEFVLEAPEGRLRVDGRLNLLPAFALDGLRYQGQLNLARLAPWVGAERPPTGLVSFSGTAAGPIESATTTVGVAGDNLEWSDLRTITLRARAVISSSAAAIESLRISAADGEILADARVPFDDRSPGHARLNWQNLRVRALVSALAANAMPSFASVAEGSAAFDWSGRALLTGRGTIDNLLRATPSSGGELPLTGRAAMRLHDGVWELSHDHRIGDVVALTGHAEGLIDPKMLPSSTLRGSAEFRVRRLSEAVALATKAGMAGEANSLSGLDGTASLTADLAGTVAAPTAAGTIEVANLRYGNTGPGVVTGRYSASRRRIVVDPLQVVAGTNSIAGHTSVDLDTRAIQGQLQGTLAQWDVIAADVPAEWRPIGSAFFDARISGTLNNPHAAGEVASDGFQIAGQDVRRLRSTLHVSDRILTIDSLNLLQREGTLEAGGTYAFSTGRFTAGMRGKGLSLSPSDTANLPIEALFDLELNGRGTLDAPQANGFMQFSKLVWDGYDVGPAEIDLDTVGRMLEFSGRAPELSAAVLGRVALSAPHTFTANATLDAPSIAKLVRRSGQPETVALGGTVSLRVQATGELDAVADATADLDVRLADVTVNGKPVSLVRPARLRYSSDAIVADDLELRVGDTALVAKGRLAPDTAANETLSVSLKGTLADLMPLARVAAPDILNASGAVDLQVRLSGRPTSPVIRADIMLASGSASFGDSPAATDINLQGSFEGGVLELREARATWQGASLTGTARVPATVLADSLPEWYVKSLPATHEPAQAVIRAGSITPAVLAPYVEEGALADVTGTVDAVVALTATSLDIQDVEAELTLARAEFALARIPLNQSRPTRLQLAGGRLQVLDWTWAGAGNRVNITGGALLTGASPALDFALDGTLDLRMLSAFSPDVATSVRAAFDVKVTGLADEPLVDGRMSIENGGLVLRQPRFAVTDLQGTVTFARDAMQLGDITANANGGMLRMTGSIQYPKFTVTGGSVAITGRGLAVELPEDLRSEVDADLRLDLSDKAPALTGSLTVLRGSYREPVSLAAQLLTGVQARTPVAASATDAGFLDRVLVNIDVKTAESVVVDNNYARLDIAANLRIVGTLAEPVPTGRMTISEGGDVFLGGRTYDVVRGTVDFMSGTRVAPTLDIALQTRVQRYDITLEVSGTPETLKASLRSPGVSQNELVALLLTGQRADTSSIVQADIARGQLLMLLSGELLGFAGRAVGLDSVQVGHGLGAAASDFDLLATDTDPSARLTVGKQLSRNVEVVFSQALSETGDVTWIALYRPVQNIELRGATQDDGSRSYEFRHELSFGAGARDTPKSKPGERSVEQVTEVRIAGTPGYPEADIRERLRVKAGDRFDFYRWQQDRDRLQRFYHEREFLEARISARRSLAASEGDPSKVTLEYGIDRGPQTMLTIDGHSMPDDLVDRMKTAWAWSVFDGFLLDDLTTLAREQLTQEGYLRADIQATVASEPDAPIKEIAIRIDPGTRYTSRQIAFSGEQAIPAATLDAAVRAQRVDASMWHEPARLQAAVLQQYRQRGYLEAAVTVQAPVFNGASAELPVQITEGRQYTIAGLDVEGATSRSREQVVNAFGVAAGSTFEPATLESARRAVELDYLREGYNNVRVTVTTTVDESRANVNLVLAVDESRQQVLAGIDVKGAEITRRRVIDRALDIEPGQTANQAEFFRAETRLYDTGAFRTVDIAVVPVETDSGGPVERVRAEVALQELPLYRFRYGFRVNDTVTPIEIDRELRPALVVDFLRRNLFGYGISAGVAGQLESDRRLLRGVVTLPRLFGLPVTTSLFATRSREQFTPEASTPFVEDESGITAEQRFAPSPRMAVTYAYDFSRSHIFEPEPLPGIPALDLQAKIARLTSTYAWDRRNDPFSPQNGWFHSSGVELGAKALGSDLRFIRYLAQQHYYKTVRRTVLASALRLGLARGFDQDLIPSERFYAGGGTTVRGFAEDGLGGVDFFGDPRGGNGMLILNQEVRVHLFKWVHGVGFLDAGNVFEKASEFSLSNLEAGAGGGIRINSPFALLRVDFGVPLTNRRRQSTGRWYFGIGHAF